MRTSFLAAALLSVVVLSACSGSRKEAAPSQTDVAAAEQPQKTLGDKAVDAAKACAEQKAKLKACDQLKWPLSTACRRSADKGACLGL